MTAYKGNLVLLKISDGGAPAQFNSVAGMRTTRMVINRQVVAVTDVESGAWRHVLAGAGKATLRVQGNGIYTHSGAEQAVMAQVLSGAAISYRLYFGNGTCLQAECVVSQYERSGKVGDMEAFSLTLESAGSVQYVEA